MSHELTLNTVYIKINAKWTTDKKYKTNILGKKIGENLQDLGQCREFFDLTPKPQSIQGKTDKLGFINMDTFVLRTIMLRWWRNKLQSLRKSDRDLNIDYEHNYQNSAVKTKGSNLKMDKRCWHFTAEHIRTENTDMKRYWASFTIRKCKSKPQRESLHVYQKG